MWAVLAGTFTLRFSTGLTGAMLAVYLATLPQHGGPEVDPIVVGLFSATFFLAELVLSPIFGVMSDRLGHHRVMLFGPAFGAIAVILTGLTTNLVVLGGTRLLEGASTAASIPSILGFIAIVTAFDEGLRGKMSARFEGATLLGLGAGFAVAPIAFATFGPTAFFLNAVVYGVSFLIFWTVKDPAGESAAIKAPHVGLRRYVELTRSAHVWLLAPTWIAVNASIGLWFSQSIFQFAKANPEFPDQVLMGGFTAVQISAAAVVVGIIFGAGLLYWGNRFKNLRRTTIILYGILGGAALVGAGLVINHSAGLAVPVVLGAAAVAAFGLFVMAGATPAALGLLADISERFPHDRGAIMGLYSVFLAIGQIIGALIGGFAADARGIDGMLIATVALLGDRARSARPVAPRRGRARDAATAVRPAVGPAGMTVGRPLVPVPLVRGTHGAVVAPHHLATAAGLGVLRQGGSAVDAAIATNAVLAVVVPGSCGIGGDAFWLIWDAATGKQLALNGSGRAAAGIDATRLRDAGHRRVPFRGPLSITVPGAVRSWGDAHRRFGRLSRDAVLGPAIELARDGFPASDEFVGDVEGMSPVAREATGVDAFDAVFRPHGRSWRPGERVRLPALAGDARHAGS